MPAQWSKLLQEQSKDLSWIINLDLELVYANKNFKNLTKKRTGATINLNGAVLDENIKEPYYKKWNKLYERALQGDFFEIEEEYHDAISNAVKYRQIIFEPLLGDDAKIVAVACQSKEIKHEVKHKSEADQLIDSSLDVFCTINEQGNFVYISAASTELWGYAPEELIGKPYMDLIVEADVAKTIETAAAVLGGLNLKTFVNRYQKKDGDIAYNIWSVRWDDVAKLMFCVARDGKEKIEQEEIILQSEQRFKTLVQEGSDLIAIFDTAGNYIYVSPTSTAVLGIAPEEFIGKNALAFVHPEDVEKTLAGLQKIASESKVILAAFRFQNHKKEWRWMETVLTNMLDNPAVKGIVANSRDVTEKIEEKQKLKLLESVITNTKDAILITEAEPFDEPGNRILFVNEAFTKMTGYSSAEVFGKSPRILQGPNSDKEALANLGRSIRAWQPCELTTINYKKSGEEFWINFALTPVADEKGWYTHWISIERDVTAQKTAEQKLQKAFDEKNKILESIGDAFFAVDNDGLVTYWNNKAELVLGRTKELMVGKYLWDGYENKMESEFFLQFKKALETKEATNFEAYSHILKKWLEVSGYPSQEGMSVYFKDISSRKVAEMNLQQANERFEKVTEATDDAIWDWDLVKKTYHRSNAIDKFFGIGASNSFINNGFWKDNFHPGDFLKVQKSINKAVADPSCDRWEFEYRMLDKQRKTVYVINRGIIIRDEKRKAIRIVGSMTNISQQKQMTMQLSEVNLSLKQYASELERSNEELEQFAFIASHDLQEPLRMVSSFLDKLQKRYDDKLDEKAHQYIHFATDGVIRMRNIIFDLLDYSKANKATDAKEIVDVKQVLSDYKFLRGELIAEKKAIIKSSDLPKLNTYKAAVVQIIHCLLDNAIKYTAAGSPPIVKLNALELDNEWQFSIEDNGIGINKEFHDKIFIIFQRLHNKEKYDGTGIGLAITKRHVEFLGGKIWLESTPGKGSTFYFTIAKNK